LIENEGICVYFLETFKFLFAGTGPYFRFKYMLYFAGMPLVLKVNLIQKNGGCFFHQSFIHSVFCLTTGPKPPPK
jgi:hypothetical protein